MREIWLLNVPSSRHLVDDSGICVCYLKGKCGGTAYTVHQAEKQGVEVVNIALLITFDRGSKNDLRIYAETTRLGSGQKISVFGRILYHHLKSEESTMNLHERGCDLITGMYNIANKQGMIAPLFPVKMNLDRKGHPESIYAVWMAFLRSCDGKGG